MRFAKLRRRWLGAALVGALALSACTGVIGDRPGSGPVDPVDKAVASLETTRFPRLSHEQWESTIVDLFELEAPTGLSQAFAGDALAGIFKNNQAVMLVSPNLWGDYQVAAEELSLMITGDATAMAAIVPAADQFDDDDERALAYITTFGKRAYRRPLSTDEINNYVALFAKGKTLLEGADDFTLGVRLTLQGFLQSPHFLYRVQGSSSVAADGLIHLNGWEIASKLSYLMWNTMPDEALFAAAEAGELATAEGIMTQAQRMLKDERAHAMVASFHAQLYQFDHYHDLYKDPTKFPGFPANIGEDMEHEAELFIEDVVFGGGGLSELLTSTVTYVNADLAAIYGLEGDYGSEFERVQLDADQRSGLLTRLGFLAANATPKEQNTIHRGVFINLRVLCADLPAPPDNVEGLPPTDDFDTNRDRVEAHTGEGTCAATCHHTIINPPGYALENYDAVGAYQVDENGFTINASTEYRLDGELVSFDGAIEMSEVLANSEAARNCYAKNWLQYGYARSAQKGDKANIAELSEVANNGSIQDLILALTQTKAFRTRAPEETR